MSPSPQDASRTWIQHLDTLTSMAARVIVLGGFVVAVSSTVTPAVREWLAGVVLRTEAFAEHLSAVQHGSVNISRRDYPLLRDGEGTRSVEGRVDFAIPFASPPAVSTGFSMVDTGSKVNTRIRVEVSQVDEAGFGYRFETWDDSVTHNVTFNWIAVGRRTERTSGT